MHHCEERGCITASMSSYLHRATDGRTIDMPPRRWLATSIHLPPSTDHPPARTCSGRIVLAESSPRGCPRLRPASANRAMSASWPAKWANGPKKPNGSNGSNGPNGPFLPSNAPIAFQYRRPCLVQSSHAVDQLYVSIPLVASLVPPVANADVAIGTRIDVVACTSSRVEGAY